jgi:capsular polysaccharide transport system permease protein
MNNLVHLSARALKISLIVVPMLLYGLYLGLVAADRYVSESVIAVHQDGSEATAALPGAAMLLAGIGGGGNHDTLYVKEFVHSQDLLLRLEQKLKLREHFGSPKLDLPYRLFAGESLEDFVRYYRARVRVLYDDRSALLRLRVESFDPNYAQQLNKAILEESERFVNESSHRMARERLRFAEGELSLAGQRLLTVRNDLLAFQSKNKLLDPTLQAQAAGVFTAELEASRSRLEAELNGMLGFLNEDAYQVKALRSRISALNKQIETERSRATEGNRRGSRLNQLAIDFQGLQLQTEFARDVYKLALTAVENARIDATRKIKSLIVVEPPSLAETAEYPLVAYNLATLLAICLLTYAIVRLVLATIREHID